MKTSPFFLQHICIGIFSHNNLSKISLLENNTNELFTDQTVSAKLRQIWFSMYILTATGLQNFKNCSKCHDLDLDAKQRE